MQPETLTQLFTQQVDEEVKKRMSAAAKTAPARIEGVLRENFPGLVQHIDVTAVAQFLARTFLLPLLGDLEEFRAHFDDEHARMPKATARPAAPALSERSASFGIRPTICVAPGCKETKGVGPATGFTCPKHRSAPKEKKAAWRKAFLEQERARLGLPLPVRQRRKGERRPGSAASDDTKILEFVASQGKNGASNAELMAATGLSIERLRQRTWRLRQKGRLRSEGNTTKARHHIVE